MSATTLDMRAEFEVDACFGSMPLGPGLCKRHPVVGDYIDAQTESVFQVWLRGHTSCTVDVRNELMRLAEGGEASIDHIEAGHVLSHLRDIGLAAKPPGR